MLNTIRKELVLLNSNKKGNAVAWVIIALIIAVAIVASVYIFTEGQTHPFWEF